MYHILHEFRIYLVFRKQLKKCIGTVERIRKKLKKVYMETLPSASLWLEVRVIFFGRDFSDLRSFKLADTSLDLSQQDKLFEKYWWIDVESQLF